MAKFCGKCGSKLDEATGLCPKCDAEKLAKRSAESEKQEEKQDASVKPKKPLSKKEIRKQKKMDKKAAKKAKKKEKRAGWAVGKKVRRFLLKIILFVLLLGMLGAGVASTLVYFDVVDIPAVESILGKLGLSPNKTIPISKFECLPSGFTTRKIDSQESALKAINDVSDIIGIGDVETELSNCKESVVLDNTYYRFQQEYKGIPVYGRNVVVSADDDGNSLMLSGNYLNINSLETEPSINFSEAIEFIRPDYSEDTIIVNEGLVIYSLSNCTPELAWKIQINDYNVNEYCFLSALSGEILAKVPLLYAESVSSSGKDIDGNDKNFMTNKVDGAYLLEDTSRGISVYDAHNSTLEKEFVIIDSNDKLYSIDGDNWVDESGNIVTIDGENFSFVIKNENDLVVGTDGEFAVRLKTANIFTKLTPIKNKSTIWNDKKAVTVMSRISSVYDFWKQEFSRKSYDDNCGELAVVCNDYMNTGILMIGDTENAYSWGVKGVPISVLSFGTDNSLSIDVIAHEFTHSVERSVSGMVYESESGALMEAYSDIFGEIIEDWHDDGAFNGTCDWIHNNNRNLIAPSKSKSGTYPDTYHGNGWKDIYSESDHGGVHTNNTVISHAAYLMWTGIGGHPAFEALSTQDIAQLFYSTLYSLPSDCTFSQFRTFLQNTADIMCEQGKLSNEQRLCVSNAMFQVGISPAPMTFTVTKDFNLCIYDFSGNLYDDYSVSISELDIANMPQGPGIEPSRKKTINYTVTNSEPFAISLNPGIYELVVTDNADEFDTYTIYLTTMPDGNNTLDINTTFGSSEIKYIPEEIVQGKFDKNKVPAETVEYNGHYYYVYDVDTVIDWDMAQEYCEAQGGYLATITSAEEDSFLYSYIVDAGYRSAMFGLSDQEKTDDWRWVTGESFSYQNWRSGEPNHQGGYEHYGMYYERNTDGTWNDGSGQGGPFICEWGEYTVAPGSEFVQEPVRTTSDERDIVLVLDVSGSMAGTPMEETKKASVNFIDTILEEDASIGIVTYDNSANRASDFSVNKNSLENIVSGIYDGGGTNIEAGLREAHSMLSSSNAKKKIIVLMSDGEPNDGKEGDALVAYADDIKEDGVLIYTLGFFENIGGYKSSAQQLMERIASDGCHYEVANADDLVFFFGDIADQLNGQKYIYVRIACPVDVSVTYQGQTLNSAESDLSLRTDFGTLTFEENEESTQNGTDDRIKVLRLKEGTDYDLRLTGTGHGLMDYTIGFMDDEGNYSDLRKFEDIKITKRTVIDTVAATSKESILNIDENGDGKYDLRLCAGENGYGEEIKQDYFIYIIVGGCVVLLLFIGVITAHKARTKKKGKVK